MKQAIIYLLCLVGSTTVIAQQSRAYTEANRFFKEGKDLYDKGLYGVSRESFDQALAMVTPVQDEQAEMLKTQAELYRARAVVRMDLPEGEKLVLDFIRKNQPDPIVDEAIYEMANFYFNDKKFEEANEYFAMLNNGALSNEQKSEVRFKQGYGHFVKKQFPKAMASFNQIKDTKGKYYYPANYYLGMSQFFQEDYQGAVVQFRKVEKSAAYRKLIPFYIAQIYFAQGQYEELIAYAEQNVKEGSRNPKEAEIRQLLGQAYFEQERYAEALPHLEYFESKNRRMRSEDFYQLAYTQYLTEHYDRAIPNFLQVSSEKSAMGQNANYYLADSYIKTGNKSSARNAFRQAASFDFDSELQEDALFQYALLSAELKYDREAIATLQQFGNDSKYYNQAQNIMTDVFTRTKDYLSAIRTIESMPNRTSKMERVYQEACYYYGLQLLSDNQVADAQIYLTKSLENPLSEEIEALAYFWKGDIAHQEKKYELSNSELNRFFQTIRRTGIQSEHAETSLAHYTQGYNYFKLEDMRQASQSFEKAISGFESSSYALSHPDIGTRLLSDAYIRSGDCHFASNKYPNALRQYDQAIKRKYQGYQYATFQKAIIQGLTGRVNDKISALRSIAYAEMSSEYTDDALLELGITYQELQETDKAKKPLEDLVKNYSQTSKLINQGLLRLGLVYYNEGNYNQALRYYKEVFQHNPTPQESQEALAALEEIYVDDLGKPDDYVAFLETVPGYKISNYTRDSLNYRTAENFYEDGNYTRAITAYTDYLRKFPNGVHALLAYYRRAECYSIEKDFTPAFQDYKIVVSKGLSDYYEQSLYKAALIAYNHEESFEEALELYSKLETVASTEDMRFEAQVGALQCAYRLNRPTEVYRLGQAVVSNERASNTQKTTAHFFIGKMAYDEERYDQAMNAFNEVIRATDNDRAAEARYRIARIYFIKGEIELAESVCDQAIQQNVNYHFWLARCLILQSDIKAEQGDFLNAKAALEAVIENFTEDEEVVAEAKRKLEAVKKREAAQNRLEKPESGNALQLDNSNQRN